MKWDEENFAINLYSKDKEVLDNSKLINQIVQVLLSQSSTISHLAETTGIDSDLVAKLCQVLVENHAALCSFSKGSEKKYTLTSRLLQMRQQHSK